jgi:5-methylcytosine-specific restriction endonuclease McrA
MADWLAQRYPVCGQPGCDRDAHLYIDHVVGLAEGGTTNIYNLWRLCWYHHDLKTTKGWTVEGEPHDWKLVPPDRGPP